MKKSIFRRPVAIIVILVAGSALFAEVAVRLIHPLDALVYQDSENPRLRFELRPGARGLKVGVPVEINAQGLRDEPLPFPRPPEERRVVVVGGQETFGLGVLSEDVFVRRLAEGLIPPGAGLARTINLSMYSYSLSQKVELACSRLAELKPELVVLQTAGNDLKELPLPTLFAPRIKNWIREHSTLVRWAAEKRYFSPAPVPAPGPVDPDQVRRELRRFKDCVSATGAAGVVMFVPSATDFEAAGRLDLNLRLKSDAKSMGLPFMDAGPALRRVPAGERLLRPNEPFLSPAAHRALAEELRRRLRPLLEQRRRPVPTPRPSV